LGELDAETRRLEGILETQHATLAEKRKHLEELRTEADATREQRRQLFGDRDPRTEEKQLQKALEESGNREKTARDRLQELQKKVTAVQSRQQTLQQKLTSRKKELENAAAEFGTHLRRAGFDDEEAFTAARLTPEARTKLAAAAEELTRRQTELRTRREERETRLREELARRLTEKSAGELEEELREREGKLQELREAEATLKHRLRENDTARKRRAESLQALETQRNEYLRWDRLHALIGSADGKKYRNFAQGLTFELMVAHANDQLRKMSDRYLLLRDPEQPLELKVLDSYQAGEIRSTKNLSGGESFIVSLALALGLSRMASRNARVDSLFLDEGFGTLDEEALDTALETLAGLQQEGKLIGIISHVGALKERIGTQIRVIPLTGGRSRLDGPGCEGG
jgi:exonuclease SbcC